MAIMTRGLARGLLGRIYEKFLHKFYVNDLWIDVRLAAKRDSVDYIIACMQDAVVRRDRFDLLSFALGRAPADGLVLEFGVEKGQSIRCLAANTGRVVHGFDSFEGLPDDWRGTMAIKGAFHMHGQLPAVPSNVRLHVGWFDSTLPTFLAGTSDAAALIHIDCDLYESTCTVFDQLAERILSGTVIVFDEYFNYPGWRQHEFKAFQEFIAARGKRYRYLAYAAEKGHVAVQIV